MKLHIVFKKAVKQALFKCAVLGFGALLGGAAWKAATTASRVCEAVKAWEDKGLHATNMWRVREVLARQGWLGPLRPNPPLDPLEACGLVPGEASACWWRLMLQPRKAGRLLACLKERVVDAEHDHEAFGARLCWGVILVLVVLVGLVAACRLVRRWGVNGHQESRSADRFVDATEADACEALVEDWATPAADVGTTEETWTTAKSVVEELIVKEEKRATPPDVVSVTVESTTPAVLSFAVEDCVESEVVKDPEEINVMATAENVESEEVKEEAGGKVYTEGERTDDDADNKAAVKAEEAAEVSPVSDDCVQDKVVSEDPEGLAADAAPIKGKATKKKKRKRKRKNLGPTDVLKASGDAQVKDVHMTDVKTDVKKKEAPTDEAKGKAVPKPEVMEKAKSVVKDVTVNVTRRKKKPAPVQPKAAPPSPPLHSVQQSWQEDVVTVRLPVPRARRSHVIGPRGDTVQQLRRDYPGVHVTVPLPEDVDAHVTFRGPKSQAAAASQEVAARLQAIEAQLREAARLRQEAVTTAVLDVAPNRRRLVVGPGGEELLKLQQQHPGVRVSVPPAIDTESRSVTIKGPPAEVRAVQAKLKNRLTAIERQRQLLRDRRRRRSRGAASAPGASPAKGC